MYHASLRSLHSNLDLSAFLTVWRNAEGGLVRVMTSTYIEMKVASDVWINMHGSKCEAMNPVPDEGCE